MDRLGELVPMPGTDIDWVISGPKGMILIEHKYPLGPHGWQPLTDHQLVIYQDLALSPRVLAVFVVRYDPDEPLPDLHVAQIMPTHHRVDELIFRPQTWDKLMHYFEMKTGLEKSSR